MLILTRCTALRCAALLAGRYLLLSSLSPALRLLSTKEGSVLRMYRGLTSKLYCSKATFISTLPRQAVATGSEDGSIFVWDLNTKEVRA